VLCPGVHSTIGRVSEPRDAVADLRRIAFLLERAHESTYRVRAFRGAAAALRDKDPNELTRLSLSGDLERLKGVGEVTARCVVESLTGEEPVYLRRLEATVSSPAHPTPLDEAAGALRAALRGDCHSHTDASDGGSPLREMAETARSLGHEYLVVTDHSPRLTVANGLSADRLRAQIEQVAELNEEFAGGIDTAGSGCSPASRSTSSTTVPSTSRRICSRCSTSSSRRCTPSCGCRGRR